MSAVDKPMPNFFRRLDRACTTTKFIERGQLFSRVVVVASCIVATVVPQSDVVCSSSFSSLMKAVGMARSVVEWVWGRMKQGVELIHMPRNTTTGQQGVDCVLWRKFSFIVPSRLDSSPSPRVSNVGSYGLPLPIRQTNDAAHHRHQSHAEHGYWRHSSFAKSTNTHSWP